MLVRIVAPHFVAGLIVDAHGRVCHAAPILRRFIGRDYQGLLPTFARNGWAIEALC